MKKKQAAFFGLSVLAVLLLVNAAHAEQGGCSNAQIREAQGTCRDEAVVMASENGRACRSLGINYCYATYYGYFAECSFSGSGCLF